MKISELNIFYTFGKVEKSKFAPFKILPVVEKLSRIFLEFSKSGKKGEE